MRGREAAAQIRQGNQGLEMGLDGGKGSSLGGKPQGEGAKGRLLQEEGGSGSSREKGLGRKRGG